MGYLEAERMEVGTNRNLPSLSEMDQIINILIFVGHAVSATTTYSALLVQKHP